MPESTVGLLTENITLGGLSLPALVPPAMAITRVTEARARSGWLDLSLDPLDSVIEDPLCARHSQREAA